jgi:hypothetical protein
MRDTWTETEFREVLDHIDEGEAKRAALQVCSVEFHILTLSGDLTFYSQPAMTRAQAKQQRKATHKSAQEQKKLAQEAKNRERKEEESLASLLGGFGLEGHQDPTGGLDTEIA